LTSSIKREPKLIAINHYVAEKKVEKLRREKEKQDIGELLRVAISHNGLLNRCSTL